MKNYTRAPTLSEIRQARYELGLVKKLEETGIYATGIASRIEKITREYNGAVYVPCSC